MADVVQMKGLMELQARMKALPVAVRGQPLKDALMAAAAPIVREATQRAPKKTGRLAGAIVARQVNTTDHDAQVDVTVRRGKGGAYYWKFLEFGHLTRAPKFLQAAQRRMRQVATSEQLAASSHMVPARPFLRPAFESQKLNALKIFADSLAAGLEAARQRLVGGGA